jgi:hypothetical protein
MILCRCPPVKRPILAAAPLPFQRDEPRLAAQIENLRTGLAKELPPGIEVEFDEQFDAMFSYNAKNYALLTKDGEVVIKGGALKSRGLEKFQRVFLEEMIKLLMEGKAGSDPRIARRVRAQNPRARVANRDVDENRHAPGFARKISPENRWRRSQSRRRLGARPNEWALLQAGRPDQLLRQSDPEENRRLRSRQARD